MQEIIVTANEAGQRLDKLLAKYLNEAPKKKLTVKNNAVTLDVKPFEIVTLLVK